MDNNSQQLAQFHTATDNSHRMRSALEVSVVALVLMVLTVFAAQSYQTMLGRAVTAEMFSIASTVKTDLIVYHAQHGVWPETAAQLHTSAFDQQYYPAKYVERLVLGAGGSVTAQFNSDSLGSPVSGKQVTMQPVDTADIAGSPVFWACGRYRASDRALQRGPDNTNIDPVHLPAICRDY